MDFVVEAPWIPFANGLAISHSHEGESGGSSGTTVAVASSNMNRIYFYDRDLATQRLTYRESVEVPFCPDNIHFSPSPSASAASGRIEEDLIIAGHPHFPSLVKVAKNATGEPLAPSWIVKLSKVPSSASSSSKEAEEDDGAPYQISKRATNDENKWKMKTLYQSDGRHFSSSTTGLIVGDGEKGNEKLYAVGLYESGLMICGS